ncbi:fluoride efflux transporter CrcB [Hyphomicrobium denitrificans]|nr:fluoride efflux transporter CrcB [Hyphomicrobium denitrificans]
MRTLLIVFVGSGVGGAGRHFLNTWITRLSGSDFPFGILTINIVGSFAMGLVAGWWAFKSNAPQDLRLFLATGILGGFTTFSTFSLDAGVLIERGQHLSALGYALGSVVFSVLALMAAMALIRSL